MSEFRLKGLQKLFTLLPFLALGFLVMATVMTAQTKPVCANGVSTSTGVTPFAVCEPQFLQTLNQRAWMEAQREVQLNNAIITKPTSVLSLSCFDSAKTKMSDGNGTTFSDGGNNSSNLSGAINNTIGTFYDDYISTNFDEPNTPWGSGCGRIQTIWSQIKCAAVNSAHFVTFGALADAGNDTIRDTGAYTCSNWGGLQTNYQNGWRSSVSLADTETARAGAAYFDEVRPDYCAFDPKAGPNALGNGVICARTPPGGGGATNMLCSNQPAIPTGLIVKYTQVTAPLDASRQYWSYRCNNPGCYYNPAANEAATRFDPASPTQPGGIFCTNVPY
jgi:hypothetical protein